jgi:hypothetical protein
MLAALINAVMSNRTRKYQHGPEKDVEADMVFALMD